MDKRIVFAVAGSGKTYYIANHFEENKKVLLLSFTNANVENIRKEVRARFNGIIPSSIEIMTFDSFVYNHLIRPLEVVSQFNDIVSVGVELRQPETDPRNYKTYAKMDSKYHYVTKGNRFYVSRISKFFNKQLNDYKKTALARLKKFFDVIYFDEFQDYTGESFKLMKYILEKSETDVIAVGDIYQSNVAPIKKDGKGSSAPFDKINTVDSLKKKFPKKVNFDDESLVHSRRVPQKVCELISEKMEIPIQSCSEMKGNYYWLTDYDEISRVLSSRGIPKLIWSRSTSTEYINNINTWGNSKGDTYREACVILTGVTSDVKQWSQIDKNSTKNKLYVALTRATESVYLITASTYKEWIENQSESK